MRVGAQEELLTRAFGVANTPEGGSAMMHLAGVKLRSKNDYKQLFISAVSFVALFFIMLAMLGQQAMSQVNTADVVGTVSDAGGAVLSGATVTIQNTAT